MEINLEIMGAKELAHTLREIPVEVKERMMPQALKAGGEVVRDNAQAIAPVDTGALATSMTVQGKKGAVLVGPNKDIHDTKDKRKMLNSNIGVFVEGGTVNHFSLLGRITAAEARRKKKNVITYQRTEQRTPPRPFLKQALTQSAAAAFEAIAAKLRALLDAKYKGKTHA
jgi:HK97 gp10 family phage protein